MRKPRNEWYRTLRLKTLTTRSSQLATAIKMPHIPRARPLNLHQVKPTIENPSDHDHSLYNWDIETVNFPSKWYLSPLTRDLLILGLPVAGGPTHLFPRRLYSKDGFSLTSTTAQTLMTAIYGTAATIKGVLNIYQGRRVWAMWYSRHHSQEAQASGTASTHLFSHQCIADFT